jgi:membrane protease YdiL (CAAX protease family)
MKSLNLPWLIATVFFISWLGVTPGLLIAHGVEIPAALAYLEILMTLGPISGAIIFIYAAHGKRGLKDLFRRLLIFKARPLLIMVAIAGPILVSFLAAFVGLRISGAAWPEGLVAVTILTNGLMIFAAYLIINTEEIVWRGVVFDRFLQKQGFVKSCLMIIPIWWLFHIPLFLYPGGHQAGYGIPEFTLIVIAQTFILGWIYVNSNFSLFYVHVHHQLINGFGQAFPIFPVFIGGILFPVRILCLLLLVLAGGLVIYQKIRPQSD